MTQKTIYLSETGRTYVIAGLETKGDEEATLRLVEINTWNERRRGGKGVSPTLTVIDELAERLGGPLTEWQRSLIVETLAGIKQPTKRWVVLGSSYTVAEREARRLERDHDREHAGMLLFRQITPSKILTQCRQCGPQEWIPVGAHSLDRLRGMSGPAELLTVGAVASDAVLETQRHVNIMNATTKPGDDR